MQHKLLHILLYIAILLSFSACEDKIEFNNYVIGEGESVISATVEFKPLVTSLGDSRAAGNAISKIEKLTVVVYDYKDELLQIIPITEEDNALKIDQVDRDGTNPQVPDPSEAKTAKATFKLPGISYGKYKMYVVANMDVDESMAETPFKLKNTLVGWDDKKVSANSQMFGYFTGANDPEASQNSVKDVFDAPTFAINNTEVHLHSWIKRLASKLTLVFDGSGLHEGIFVYIHKATIHDIPRYCHLGEENRPYWTKENKYVTGHPKEANYTDSIIENGESLYYGADGTVSPIGTDVDNTESLSYEYVKANWLEIDKATTAAGAVEEGKKHPETAQALYFYENCQGDYAEAQNKKQFNKHQQWDKVGTILKPGDEDWKDEVPCGTYVEVEGYYSANYNGYLSNGPIKYRFMLGQDTEYNYNALRNRHYKLYLGFRGYANQPDWHIEYDDEEPGLYPPSEFLMSYMYNVRHEMPIRLTGNPKKVTMQIVENNWAPYDPSEQDLVPKKFIDNPNPNGLDFEWNKQVYENKTPEKNFWYGLHSIESGESTPYNGDILKDAPDWVSRNVTPIWAGFLALQAPSGYEGESTQLPTGVYNNRYGLNQENFYDQETTLKGLRGYFYGDGDRNDLDNGGNVIRQANSIPLYQNVYNIPAKEDLTKDALITFSSGKDDDRTGRNSFRAGLNDDKSVTIYVPMFTQPKDLIYISGFSGNNPYESFYRKAVVKITAEYEGHPNIVKYVPVFQTRRMVNPKAVWRSSTDVEPFTVIMMSLDKFSDEKFTPLESMGVWEAWVADPNEESKSLEDTFWLTPLGDAEKIDGKIKGITGSKIIFQIKFKAIGQNETKCGKIIIHYHNLHCEHTIYVRQGYNVPVKVTGEGAEHKYWSSYAVYSFDSADDSYKGKFKPVRGEDDGVWSFPEYNENIPGLKATLTLNPLALGTMYKRGNYAEGIKIINNKTFPVLTVPVDLKLTTGDINDVASKTWDKITGIPYLDYKFSSKVWTQSYVDVSKKWQWSEFESTVPDEQSDKTYVYDLPTIDDIELLTQQGFGIGVAYADGATKTAFTTSGAFGFFSGDNSARTDTCGMRGFIVYNTQNYNQIFFPLGYSGVGRRTIQNNDDKPGLLRYGNQANVLSVAQNANNQYRPIPYNNPNNPGAVYWAKKTPDDKALFGLDMNYFDLTFGPYDYAIDFVDYGDALPIKPVVVREITTPQSRRR